MWENKVSGERRMANCDYEPNLSAAEFFEMLREVAGNPDVVIVDIRTPDEFDVYHLTGAVNIDFYAWNFRQMLDELERDKTYLIYCRTGRRTGTADNNALDLMLELGFTRVYNMLGGIHEFVKVPGTDDFVE